MILLKNLPQCIRFMSNLKQSNFLINKNLYQKSSNQIKLFCSSAKEINSNQEKIYNGTLTSQIKAVKIFSVTTSMGGLIAQPILIEQGSKIGGMPMVVFLCGFVGFFTFVTPFLLHIITKRYVTEVHYNSQNDEYTATTLSFFLQKKLTKFQIKDVIVPELPGIFTTFLVRKQGLFVDPSLFPDPNHYIKIMGYDKPLDFKLELNENKVNENSDKTK